MEYSPVGVRRADGDSHRRIARTRRRYGLRVKGYRATLRHAGGGQADCSIESAAAGSGYGGDTLIAFLDRKRCRRGREREARRVGNGQSDGGALLHASAIAGHGYRIGARRRARSDRDVHGRIARAGRRYALRVEAHRRARGNTCGRQTNGAVEAATDGRGDGGAALVALLNAHRRRRSREREAGLRWRSHR